MGPSPPKEPVALNTLSRGFFVCLTPIMYSAILGVEDI